MFLLCDMLLYLWRASIMDTFHNHSGSIECSRDARASLIIVRLRLLAFPFIFVGGVGWSSYVWCRFLIEKFWPFAISIHRRCMIEFSRYAILICLPFSWAFLLCIVALAPIILFASRLKIFWNRLWPLWCVFAALSMSALCSPWYMWLLISRNVLQAYFGCDMGPVFLFLMCMSGTWFCLRVVCGVGLVLGIFWFGLFLLSFISARD